MHKERVPSPKIESNGAKNETGTMLIFLYMWMGSIKGWEGDNGKWKYNLLD